MPTPNNNVTFNFIEALKKLHDATTPGDWEIASWFNNAVISKPSSQQGTVLICGKVSPASSNYDWEPNAKFIMHVHNHFPDIVEQLQEHEEHIEILEGQLKTERETVNKLRDNVSDLEARLKDANDCIAKWDVVNRMREIERRHSVIGD